MQANAFELEADLSGFTPYQRGGIVTQHKSPKQLAFKALQVASLHAVTPALWPCCPGARPRELRSAVSKPACTSC